MRLHKLRYIFAIFTIVLINSYKAQNVNVSQSVVFDGEPYIAINPSNSNHLVVAWMGWKLNNAIVIKTKYSLDGGNSWSNEVSIPHSIVGNTSADPSISFNSLGDVYICYIDYDSSGLTNGSVYIVKSTNVGATWSLPIEVISLLDCPNKFCIDRPWMVIDKSSGVNDGTIYISSMNADQNVTAPYNPYLTVSTNGGTSFNAPRFLDTANYLSGSLIPQPMPSPTISANGSFLAVYPSYVSSQSVFAEYYVAKSIDQGNSINYHSALSLASGFPTDDFAKNGQLMIADPSDDNHLAVLYFSISNGDQDVMLIETYDGLNWNSPIRVNDDLVGNGVLQDLVWADFDTDGDLVVSWRDRRNGTGSGFEVDSEIYGAVRWKDSVSFSANFPISDMIAAHDTILHGKANDFMNTQIQNDTLYSVWGDVRNGKMTIWFNRIDLATGSTFVTEIISNRFLALSPNPSSSIISVKDIQVNASISIFNLHGKLVETFYSNNTSENIDISSYSKGVYMILVSEEQEIRKGRFIVE